MIYFAYGANLDRARMRSLCPESRFVGPGRLLRYVIQFVADTPGLGGVATLAPDTTGHVFGLLYLITWQDLAALDESEGWPRKYDRRNIDVSSLEGSRDFLTAMTYYHMPPLLPTPPKPEYLEVITKARALYGEAPP